MKKNRMMRLASILLVCVLLTTSVISGTFAKYTTTASGSDSARVAYWGFNDDGKIEIDNLFLTAYDTGNDDKTVSSSTKVIAPGTKNEVTFTFNYNEANGLTAPEVDYSFAVSTEGSSCAQDIQNNTNIQWTFDGSLAPAVTVDETEYAAGSWTALLKAIEGLAGTGDYEAGNLPTSFADSHKIGWEWKIGTTDEEHKRDAAMGNKGSLDTVKLVITITATQID